MKIIKTASDHSYVLCTHVIYDLTILEARSCACFAYQLYNRVHFFNYIVIVVRIGKLCAGSSKLKMCMYQLRRVCAACWCIIVSIIDLWLLVGPSTCRVLNLKAITRLLLSVAKVQLAFIAAPKCFFIVASCSCSSSFNDGRISLLL